MTDLTAPLHALPDPLPVPPLPALAARTGRTIELRPPGSKSLTNRAYVLAALSKGESRLARPLRSDDCDRLLAALTTLGARAEWDGADVVITGVDGRFPNGGEVNLGDGGTPTRFMIAAACLTDQPVLIDGSKRMRERPVAEGVELLRNLGADIEYVEADGRLPLRVNPSPNLAGGTIEVGRTASSQFLSALMLVAPWLANGVRIEHREPPTSASYLALTVDALRAVGAPVEVERDETGEPLAHIVAPGPLAARSLAIEPDASSAVYGWGAAALAAGLAVRVAGLSRDSAQPDVRILDALQAAGARVESDDSGTTVTGPSTLAPIDWDASQFPDGAMALAAVLSRADGRSRISGLHTLRVKETDRLAALAVELERLGCRTRIEGDDALIIEPGDALDRTDGVTIATYNDHRMAMAFAMLGLVRRGVRIADPRCVEKSYPTFWRDLAALTTPA